MIRKQFNFVTVCLQDLESLPGSSELDLTDYRTVLLIGSIGSTCSYGTLTSVVARV